MLYAAKSALLTKICHQSCELSIMCGLGKVFGPCSSIAELQSLYVLSLQSPVNLAIEDPPEIPSTTECMKEC